MPRPEGDPPEGVPLPLNIGILGVLMLVSAADAIVLALGLSSAAPRVAPWVEVPLGLLVLLFAPGYGLVALGAGERPRWPWYLTWILIVSLSVGFNLAVGFVLLEFHLGVAGFAIAAAAFIVDGAAIGRFLSGPAAPPDPRFGAMVRRELRLPGFSSGQRAIAYALLLAIVIVFAGLVYLASVEPHQQTDVSLGITNANGNVTQIPHSVVAGTTITLLADIGNNGTSQNWTLVVRSTQSGAAPTNFTTVPWASPIQLLTYANSTASESIAMGANQMLSEPINLVFADQGPKAPSTNCTVSFVLENSAGDAVRQTSILFTITP